VATRCINFLTLSHSSFCSDEYSKSMHPLRRQAFRDAPLRYTMQCPACLALAGVWTGRKSA
jgi:hypothetical protein